jgi:hypothetical protein
MILLLCWPFLISSAEKDAIRITNAPEREKWKVEFLQCESYLYSALASCSVLNARDTSCIPLIESTQQHQGFHTRKLQWHDVRTAIASPPSYKTYKRIYSGLISYPHRPAILLLYGRNVSIDAVGYRLSSSRAAALTCIERSMVVAV